MPNRVSFLAVLLCLAALPGCRRPTPGTHDPALLSLDGQEIARAEFEHHVATLEAQNGPLSKEVRRAVLQSFLEQRVLVLEARAKGLVPSEASPAAEEAGVRQLLATSVLAGQEVSEEEVQAYYASHQEEFSLPERVTLRQVLTPTANEALEARRRLLRNPKDFELVARSLSHGPEASQGGLMGSFARGELPTELEQAAFALPPGGLSEVVKSPLGYHVLRVEAHDPARARPLAECREEVRARLGREKSDRAVHDYVQGLLARAKVNHDVFDLPTDR